MYQKEIWRNSRSLSERLKISWVATQRWSDRGEMDELAQKDFTYRPSTEEFERYIRKLVFLAEHIWQKCTDETPIRLPRSINKYAPSSPWVWRRATWTDSFLAVSAEWPLVELINSSKSITSELVEWAASKNRATCWRRFLTKLLRVTLWQDFLICCSQIVYSW